MSKRLTTEGFIIRANSVHGERYDYSEAVYRNYDTPLTIICREHGPFQQSPSNHLQGKGCKRCGFKKSSRRLTTQVFVVRARHRHPGRYDYTLVEYQNGRTPVTIICPSHGKFLQAPEAHLAGKGCWQCAGNKPRPVEDIIKELRYIHQDRYIYDANSFTNSKGRIEATCKEHGPFRVSYYRHRKGAGCPQCTGHYHFRQNGSSCSGRLRNTGRSIDTAGTGEPQRRCESVATGGMFSGKPLFHISGDTVARSVPTSERNYWRKAGTAQISSGFIQT